MVVSVNYVPFSVVYVDFYFSLRCVCVVVFFFQAEDGIRDLVRSRGLGDVYKRQILGMLLAVFLFALMVVGMLDVLHVPYRLLTLLGLSLIHI